MYFLTLYEGVFAILRGAIFTKIYKTKINERIWLSKKNFWAMLRPICDTDQLHFISRTSQRFRPEEISLEKILEIEIIEKIF